MSDLPYFDSFVRIGPRTDKHPSDPWRLTDVLAEMEHCSISGALVASTQSVLYDPMRGNLDLVAQLRPHDHLFPIWNAMPHHGGDFPEPSELGRLMARHGVRAVTLSPATNAWDILASSSRDLLRLLEQNRVLTILGRMEIRDFRDLETLLSRHPKLPVLLNGAVTSDARQVLPLLRHRNLHLSFDHLHLNRGVEFLVERGHADQLVYGSNTPVMNGAVFGSFGMMTAMGAHRCYLDYAEVPDAARRKIAGGNLARLLQGQKPPRLRENHNEDRLMALARRGRPLSTPVIDMHMHMLDEGLQGAGGANVMPGGGPRAVFRQLKRLGVVGGGFMSWNGPVSADSVAGNATVRRGLEDAPRGYWGLGTFDPVHFTQDELKRLVYELYRDSRFIGMKPYYVFGVEYSHSSYDVWWEHGNRLGLYALIHRTRSDEREVDVLAKKYPRVRWLIAHSGCSYRKADQAIEMVRKHRNVCAEITMTSVPMGIMDYLVEHAGEDRVLYGSDLPMRDPRQQLGWVIFSRLTVEQKIKVLGGNALRVLQPCASRLPAYNRPKGLE